MRVAVVPPALKGDRWHEVISCDEGDRAGQLVHLSGVDGIAAAQELRDRYVLAREDELPEDLSLHDPQALCGREVEDAQAGLLGTIQEVMVGPANDVWVVSDGVREVLLPVIESVVRGVPDEGPIAVDATGFLGEWEAGA